MSQSDLIHQIHRLRLQLDSIDPQYGLESTIAANNVIDTHGNAPIVRYGSSINEIDSLLSFCFYLSGIPSSRVRDMTGDLSRATTRSVLGHGASFEVLAIESEVYPDMYAEPNKRNPTVVAIKVPVFRFGKNSKENEARALRGVAWDMYVMSHEPLQKCNNIAKYFGITWAPISVTEIEHEVKLVPSLVMEHADIGTLDDLLNPEQYSLIFRLKWSLIMDVANGMSALHEESIVHGDLKAQNVLLFSDPKTGITAKVADFGFSFHGSSRNQQATETEFKGYTPPWEAPEVTGRSMSIKSLTRADIYSFGLLVWRVMLEGETPLDNDEAATRYEGFENLVVRGPLTRLSVILDLKRRDNDGFLSSVLGTLANKGLDRQLLDPLLMQTIRLDPEDRIPVLSFTHLQHLAPEPRHHEPNKINLDAFEKGQVFLDDDALQGVFLDSGITGQKTILDLMNTQRTKIPLHVRCQIHNDLVQEAMLNNSKHKLDLALTYLVGFGVKQDTKHGLDLLIEVAQKGDIRAKAIMVRIHGSLEREVPCELPIQEWLFEAACLGSNIALQDLSARNPTQADIARAKCFDKYKYGVSHINFDEEKLAVFIESHPSTLTLQSWIFDNELSRKYGRRINKWSALHFAAVFGKIDLMKSLLDKGGDVNSRTITGETPLLVACRAGQYAAAEVLLERGADVTLPNFVGQTVMHYLIYFDDDNAARFCKLFVSRGGDIHAISIAAMAKRLEVFFIGEEYYYDGTPLHWAIQVHRALLVRILLENGANPLVVHQYYVKSKLIQRLLSDEERSGTETALDLAIEFADSSLLQILLEHEEVKIQLGNPKIWPRYNRSFYSPDFLKMCRYGSVYQSELFRTARLLRPEHDTVDHLIEAVMGDSRALVEYLLSNGCDVNSEASCGFTPIQAACIRADPALVGVTLLNAGADPGKLSSQVTANCLSVLMMNWVGGCCIDLIRELVFHGCTADKLPGSFKWLHDRAIKEGHFELAKFLLECPGVDIKTLGIQELLNDLLRRNDAASSISVKYLLEDKVYSACLRQANTSSTVFHQLALVPEMERNDALNSKLANFLITTMKPEKDKFNYAPANSTTALSMAIRNGNHVLFGILLEHGADALAYNLSATNLSEANLSATNLIIIRMGGLLYRQSRPSTIRWDVEWTLRYKRRLNNTTYLIITVLRHLRQKQLCDPGIRIDEQRIRRLVEEWQSCHSLVPRVERILRFHKDSCIKILFDGGRQSVVVSEGAPRPLSKEELTICLDTFWNELLSELAGPE